MSDVAFRWTPSEIEVSVCGSAGDGGRDVVGSLPLAADWRDRLQLLLTEAEPVHEECDPSKVEVTGARGLEAELLRLAWSGPGGARATAALLALSDKELEAMCEAGALHDPAVKDHVGELNELLDSDDEAILASLRSGFVTARSTLGFEWSLALNRARATEAEARSAQELADAARSAALAPYADEIESVLREWWRSVGGATSVASQQLQSCRKAAVNQVLVVSVLSTGRLPEGKQRIPVRAFQRYEVIEVDFDALRRAQ